MFARLSAFVTSALLLAAGVQAAQNQLQQVTANIGPNPNGVLMYVYKPTKLASPLPLVVAIHYCTGTASAYFTGTQYANLADTYGYIVIYPQSPRSGTCFDVNTNQTLTHNGGGDSQGIASMITYAIANYGVSASHVFVTGSSSGAMMTNVMAGSYPNLFQAGTVYNGVPFACFAGASSWNSACAEGQVSKTGAQWGDLVRNAYPGYTGARPRMLLYHGTVDTTLAYPNYGQEILQWTNVLGVSSTPSTTTANNPQANYTKTTYGNQVLGYSAAGVGHTVPVHETLDLAFFGIAGTSPLPPPGGATTSVPPASSSVPPASSSVPPATSTTPPTGATSPQYGQCGGTGWTGPTACASPFTCKYSNAYYSQCL